MPRLMLTDEHWSKLKIILLQQAIYLKPDLRMTVEGILIECAPAAHGVIYPRSWPLEHGP